MSWHHYERDGIVLKSAVPLSAEQQDRRFAEIKAQGAMIRAARARYADAPLSEADEDIVGRWGDPTPIPESEYIARRAKQPR